MAVKPTDGHIEWISDDDPAKYVEPSAAKRLQGWIAEEKPPFQYFNWAWRLIDRWLKWADVQSDENIAAIATNAQTISDEEMARVAADTALQGNIDTEATVRFNADTAHANETDAHSATSNATAERIMLRDSNGRCQVAAPDAGDDCARKADVDAIGALGTFVNSVFGYPNVSEITITPTELIENYAYESIGPTGSGATNEWAALDVVPSDVDWIEVSIIGWGRDGTYGDRSMSVRARAGQTSISFSGFTNMVYYANAYIDSSGKGSDGKLITGKIPVSSRIFTVGWSSDFTTNSIIFLLTGYGYNRPS